MRSPAELCVAVYGPGLLGGSLLMDLRRLGAREARAWARRPESVDTLRERGLADFASTDPRTVAEGADLVILATPVGAMENLAREIVQTPGLKPDCVVTDVGSVKGMVLSGAGRVCKETGVKFIGSHPMAGSEAAGLDAARARLFENAPCILTPEADTAPETLEIVRAFWELLGGRVTEMDAARHDEVVARISHLPRLGAAAVALAALEKEPELAFWAAGGLRDTTRVAAGDAGMWREILLENRDAVLPALADLHRITGELLEILRKRDEDALFRRLDDARRARAVRWP